MTVNQSLNPVPTLRDENRNSSCLLTEFLVRSIRDKIYENSNAVEFRKNPTKKCQFCGLRNNGQQKMYSFYNTGIYRHHIFPKESYPNEHWLIDVCGKHHGMIHLRLNRIKKNARPTMLECITAINMVVEHYHKWCIRCNKLLKNKNKDCKQHYIIFTHDVKE